MSIRIVIACIGFLSAVFAPPWLTLVCVILLAMRYRAWEAIVLGVLVDLQWLPHGPAVHLFPVFTTLTLIIVWGLEPLRIQFLE